MEQAHKIQQKAGGILIRKRDTVIELFLIHRHRYDDWSFPKGHIDAGESLEEAALREVREETGFEAQIFGSLPDMQYTDPQGNEHHVAWFAMVVVGETGAGLDATEVDGGEWFVPNVAREKLSYDSAKEYLDVVLPLIKERASAL
jgi:8-oxo-dGTP pyrophosphatase MutT (NUDIX family)